MSGGGFTPSLLYIRSKDGSNWMHQGVDEVLSAAWNNYLQSQGLATSNQVWKYSVKPSKIIWDSKRPIQDPRGVRVNKAVIPNSIPTFSESNYQLQIMAFTQTVGLTHMSVTINMPRDRRFVTAAEVAAEINSQLLTWQPGGNFTCTADAETRRLSFNSTHANYSIRNVSENVKLGLLGPVFSISKGFMAHAPVDLKPTQFIYIKSQCFKSNSAHMSNEREDIIAMIPWKESVGEFGGDLVYECARDANFVTLLETQHNQLDFELLDDDMQPVDLKQKHWALELSLIY